MDSSGVEDDSNKKPTTSGDDSSNGKPQQQDPEGGSTWKGSSSNMSSSGSMAEQPLGSAGEDDGDDNLKASVPSKAENGEVPPESAGGPAVKESGKLHKSTSQTTKGHSSRRGSSLELRKLPVNVLLRPESSKLFDEELSMDDGDSLGEMNGRRNLLQRTCLNSKFTLRSQMMLSFGVISASTILLVVVVCVAVSIISGEVVKDETRSTFNGVSQSMEAKATRYIAEDLTPRLLMEDVVQMLYEVTLDRYFGYPNDDDSTVPFFDTLTQTNKYPIKGKPLPLDWQIEANVNEENAAEHVQDRLSWWGDDAKVSTVNAAYFMQGMCDPSETDPTQATYLEGCTDDNNDIASGGVFAPSPTNEQIHRKGADIVPILKTLFEYHQELRAVAVFFSNSGAGSTVTYPGTQLDGRKTYQSIGCDYLKGPHPLDPSRSILSEEDIERCTNNGLRVENASIPTRLYSPLDRGWCQSQILNPGKVMVTGPFLDAWTSKLWLLSVGKAIYDPVTKELIACTNLDLDVESALSAIVQESTVTDNSQVTIVRWNTEGTVVSSSAWDINNANTTVTVSEITVGVSQEAYEELYDLVDYDTVWNASEIQQIYEDFVVIDGGFQVKAYPMPPIPSEYDATYEPIFLVLFSLSEADIFVFADKVEHKVDARVRFLTILSVVVGLAGLAVVLAILVAVSNYITRPLRKMNETAKRIIDNFGEDSKIEVEDSTKEAQGWIKTELTEIVSEFQRMVRKFSGGAMARSAKAGVSEVDNQFKMMDEFQELYASRLDESFKYKIEESTGGATDSATTAARQHFGSNIFSGGASTVRNSASQADLLSGDQSAYSSPLFRWIVALIVLPLLLSTIIIAAAVIATVSQALPDMIKIAEDGLIELQVRGLEAFTGLRAGFVARSSERSIRDLHVLARYTSWLLFGAIDVVGFPNTHSGADYCKTYDNDDITTCPFVQENHVCDCEWNERNPILPCEEYSNSSVHSRYLQVPHFVASSEDADETGARNSTSFPAVADTPETTAWWRSQHEVPGSPRNVTDSSNQEDPFIQGYGTTYQRLRAAVASPIYIPMYNYDSKQRDTFVAAFVTFEADGLMVAYSGCRDMYHAADANFQSSTTNGAYLLRPELCPLDKYGYDPRCRGWYDGGRQRYMSDDADELYVTPPYNFAGGTRIGQSCTAPIFDPETKEHLGQLLVDFVSTSIFDSLERDRAPLAKDGFYLLITMEEDNFDADVVIGPGLTAGDTGKPLKDVVNARNETCDDSDPCGFDEVARAMKAGEEGSGQFVLEDENGTAVNYHIAYSPVIVKSLKQVNASDFSSGVVHEDYYLYSLALAEPEASILEAFEEAEDDIEEVIHVGIAVLSTLIVVATCLVVWISQRIVMSMIEPMYFLLELIRQINRLDVGEDPPEEELHGGYGSSEVLNVRMTMEKLYKIIQCANAAYFAGETEVAYQVFTDALQLFTRLDNRKAMGVANNNLGNTMLTFYRTMQATREDSICGMTKRQLIGKGMAYFHQAIQLGEKAYDSFYEAEGWSPNCLHFMQHLSNRYFNRAMFLLTVKDDHEKPKEIEELGRRDLQIARDMDVEIVDEGTQVGWDVRSAEAHYEVLLSRLRGHITLLEMDYPDEWDVDEMLDNAFKILKTELKKKDASDLFTDVGPAGRMQQFEFLMIRYSHVNGDLGTAAKLAIRMLVEDEFILPEAQKTATDTIIAYAKESNMSPGIQRRLKAYQDWLRDAVDELDTQRSSKDVAEGTRSSFVAAMPLASVRLLEVDKSNPNSVASLRESMRGDIVMEAF